MDSMAGSKNDYFASLLFSKYSRLRIDFLKSSYKIRLIFTIPGIFPPKSFPP